MKKQKNTKGSILFRRLGVLAGLFILLLFSLAYRNGLSSPKADACGNGELMYQSVHITNKDTLWSIASEHYTKDYQSIPAYIKEIKRCNRLTSDTIHAGSFLLVPYYAHRKNL